MHHRRDSWHGPYTVVMKKSDVIKRHTDVSFGRVWAAQARLLVIVFSCAFKQSMISFGP